MNTQQSPLAGICVIEAGNVTACPCCPMLLAGMGADVAKIEHADGRKALCNWSPINDG